MARACASSSVRLLKQRAAADLLLALAKRAKRSSGRHKATMILCRQMSDVDVFACGR